MSLNPDNLLRDAGRLWEVFIGWVCAVISVAIAGLLVWILYLVYWRNPRESDVSNPDNPTALAIFGMLLLVAVGFSVIGFRLLSRRAAKRGLMSPLLLRLWGAFFSAMSAIILVDAIVNKKWNHILRSCEIFSVSISTACAAFILARRRDRSKAIENPICR